MRPNVVRFEGNASVVVSPFSPPGFVSFGWTRTEPANKASDADNLGYGTISLVDYRVTDAAGNTWADPDRVIAISPLHKLPGDEIPPVPAPAGFDDVKLASSSPALRLVAPHQAKLQSPEPALADVTPTVVRYYRTSVRCYADNESPYAFLQSEQRRTITAVPSLRDVFGNRFRAKEDVNITPKAFYTDALIAPAEWPGFRFSVFPESSASGPQLSLEIVYSPVPTENVPAASVEVSRRQRIQRLGEILNQINGIGSDVRVMLSAKPLLNDDVVMTPAGLLQTAIRLETNRPAVAPAPVQNLQKFPCGSSIQVDTQTLFQPFVIIERTDAALAPKELPDGLAKIISDQILFARSPTNLTEAATMGQAPDSGDNEFREVAKKFQSLVEPIADVQVGFLRDQFNRHELWLLPNKLFPAARAGKSDWTFATARPFDNRLQADAFQSPDFSATNEAGTLDGFPLKDLHVVDQDLDELGRAAFRLIESEGFRPEIIAVADPVDAQAALRSKNAIATTLSDLDKRYIIPLFTESSSAVDAQPITRLTLDAFQQNLTEFYAVDTILQLPLLTPAAKAVTMFQAKVVDPFGAVAADARPTFSDVLLAGGQTPDASAILLYRMPAGADPGIMPPVSQITVSITHLQRDWDSPNPLAQVKAFNQGLWIELAVPKILRWTPQYSAPVPVAVRRFPQKPSLDVPKAISVSLGDGGNATLTPQKVVLLTKWGWTVSLRMEGLATDTATIAIRYNDLEEETVKAGKLALASVQWSPATLLQCFVAMKQLGDNLSSGNLNKISVAKRFKLIAAFVSFVDSILRRSTVSGLEDLNLQPVDTFVIDANSTVPGNPKFQVMSPAGVKIEWKALPDGVKQGTLTAAPDDPLNKAFLVSASLSVYNFRPSVVITRNANIAGHGHTVDGRLIYTSAPVESPDPCLVSNVWNNAITRTRGAGETLKESLQNFLDTLLNGAALSSIALEVAASVHCERESLSFETPFSVIPFDLMPVTTEKLADLIFNRCASLLGQTGDDVIPPPDMPIAFLQLHLKISRIDGNKRPLLQVDSVRFPLR